MELCRRYSNRPELLKPLVSAVCKIHDGLENELEDLGSVRSQESPVWRVDQKVTQSDVRSLLEAYQDGSTAQALADKHGISLSSLKRLLRKHNIRKNCASGN